MKKPDKRLKKICSLISEPSEPSISGLRIAALNSLVQVCERHLYLDIVCGFDDECRLRGLLVDDADNRPTFQATIYEYGFSLAFDDSLDCTIRVWVGDDLDWIGTEDEALALLQI